MTKRDQVNDACHQICGRESGTSVSGGVKKTASLPKTTSSISLTYPTSCRSTLNFRSSTNTETQLEHKFTIFTVAKHGPTVDRSANKALPPGTAEVVQHVSGHAK